MSPEFNQRHYCSPSIDHYNSCVTFGKDFLQIQSAYEYAKKGKIALIINVSIFFISKNNNNFDHSYHNDDVSIYLKI